jgi:hypothetical protein
MGAGWTGTTPGGSPERRAPRRNHQTCQPAHTAARVITAALDADVSCATRKRPPHTLTRGPPERARGSLDRHATYIVAAYIVGAAR